MTVSIKEIATEINERSLDYQFGNLQNLRKQIKGLSKRASSQIFKDETISDDGWAFHYGGRKELQFNIGFEKEGFRYGIAFSLETSRSLPNLDILYPKILKLNSVIREKPYLFRNYQMWYWQNGRSEIKKVSEINENLVKQGTFIFIGKLTDENQLEYDEILKTFDHLLKVYIEVETNQDLLVAKPKESKQFIFSNAAKRLPQKREYSTVVKEISVDARHSYLQEKLFAKLQSIYGESNVGLENEIDGNRIDIVVKDGNEFIFYEVKTASSAKSCIRQAIGQLMEYAYWQGESLASKIVVAGEFKANQEALNYLKYLNSEFNIPIKYERVEK